MALKIFLREPRWVEKEGSPPPSVSTKHSDSSYITASNSTPHHTPTVTPKPRGAELLRNEPVVFQHTHKNRHTPSQSAINRVSIGSLLTITVMIILHPTLTRSFKHALSTVYSLTQRPRAQAVSSAPDTAVLFLLPPYR